MAFKFNQAGEGFQSNLQLFDTPNNNELNRKIKKKLPIHGIPEEKKSKTTTWKES